MAIWKGLLHIDRWPKVRMAEPNWEGWGGCVTVMDVGNDTAFRARGISTGRAASQACGYSTIQRVRCRAGHWNLYGSHGTVELRRRSSTGKCATLHL
jgi:hypothetical protein